MDRILILTADSGEELEVYYMLYRLREAGYEVDVAAPQRKTLQLVVHDFAPGWDTYVERPRRRPASRSALRPRRPRLAGREDARRGASHRARGRRLRRRARREPDRLAGN